jgi:Na+:H+ antiporter, NhaA family
LNSMGVRRVLPYAVLGIGGLWLAFLLSGVHATVAAVLAAFAIPSDRSIDKEKFVTSLDQLKTSFERAKCSKKEAFLLSPDEENIIGQIKRISDDAISPLQNLEQNMHGLVLYLIMPIFALANAGVVMNSDWQEMLSSPVSLGVIFGLVAGKFVGIFGISMLGLKMGWFKMPNNMNTRMLLGVSFLAGIGFTMSLFITSLAFSNDIYAEQAKMGVLAGSLLSGILGYLILKSGLQKMP